MVSVSEGKFESPRVIHQKWRVGSGRREVVYRNSRSPGVGVEGTPDLDSETPSLPRRFKQGTRERESGSPSPTRNIDDKEIRSPDTTGFVIRDRGTLMVCELYAEETSLYTNSNFIHDLQLLNHVLCFLHLIVTNI